MLRQVAFITYNTVGDGVADGWHQAGGRRAYVLQNSKGERFTVDNLGYKEESKRGEYSRADSKYVGGVRDEISNLWRKLQEILHEIDHLVVYVGSAGSERAIELATQLPEIFHTRRWTTMKVLMLIDGMVAGLYAGMFFYVGDGTVALLLGAVAVGFIAAAFAVPRGILKRAV